MGKNLSTAAQKAAEVIRTVEALKQGDRVVVLWHDACRVTNDPDVRPEYYSTPKETQGTVYDCLPDPEYPEVFYLIVSGETTSGRPDYYDAIPTAWIAKIQRLEITTTKRPAKVGKLATDLYTVDRVIVYKNKRIHEDSGGIEKIPRKWTRSDMNPLKFVEQITKVAR